MEQASAHLLEITLLTNDGSDTASRQSSSSSTDQLCERSEELSFLEGGLDTEEVGEDTDHGEQLIGGVTRAGYQSQEHYCKPVLRTSP